MKTQCKSCLMRTARDRNVKKGIKFDFVLNKPLAEGSTSSKVTLDRFLTLNRCSVDGVSLDFHLLLL